MRGAWRKHKHNLLARSARHSHLSLLEVTTHSIYTGPTTAEVIKVLNSTLNHDMDLLVALAVGTLIFVLIHTVILFTLCCKTYSIKTNIRHLQLKISLKNHGSEGKLYRRGNIYHLLVENKFETNNYEGISSGSPSPLLTPSAPSRPLPSLPCPDLSISVEDISLQRLQAEEEEQERTIQAEEEEDLIIAIPPEEEQENLVAVISSTETEKEKKEEVPGLKEKLIKLEVTSDILLDRLSKIEKRLRNKNSKKE